MPDEVSCVVQRTRLRVNGQDHELGLGAEVTLLDALRDHLHMYGTKRGCDLGQCGACTVLADGRRINACLALAVRLDGVEITTIEGLVPAGGEGLASDGALHPLQAAFIAHDALQCGYCTPGQIMSAVALIAEGRAGNPEEVRRHMSGNLCRCGAYGNILAAIDEVSRGRANDEAPREDR